MAKETYKEVGHGLDGSLRFTLSAIFGLLLLIGGILLIVYANTYIIGVPLVVLGLLLPIFLEFALSSRAR